MRLRKRNQTIVEYVLIIALVAVAAIGLLGIFSDTVREKITGIISVFDDEKGDEARTELENNSEDLLKDLDEEGLSE